MELPFLPKEEQSRKFDTKPKGMCQMFYSVLGGNSRSVEVANEDPTQPPYCMATHSVLQIFADAVFLKKYSLRNFIANYRFSVYGEKYIDGT